MKSATLKVPALLPLMIMAWSVATAQPSFTPTNLGPTVNSKYADINPVLHPDGKTLYFSRANHPENRYGEANSQDVWYSVLNNNGTWSEAKRLPNSVNIGRYNAVFGILEDGKTFLINGKYTKNGKHWVNRGLSLIEQTDSASWSAPKALRIRGYSRKNRGRATVAYITPDQNRIIVSLSKRSNGKRNSLYIASRTDSIRYGKLHKLYFEGKDNGGSYEAPYLSADGNTLYFSCKVRGNYNLYMSSRTDDSYMNWSRPSPVGSTINTSNWENYFRLNKKGNWGYFCSDSGSIGRSDIYRIKIFEDNPNVRLSGLILRKPDDKLMLADTNYTITFNGNSAATLKIDKVSASYEVLLPFGHNYVVKPELQNWIGIADTLKADNINEYTEVNRNLYFESIPFVKIFGKLINVRTGQPLASDYSPKVLINNHSLDTAIKYGPQAGEYSAILPLGSRYIVMPKVPNFSGRADTVDVTNAIAYTEREVNLHVQSVPWVEVKGTALDNSAFTPIAGVSHPKLMVNGYTLDSIAIDPVNGSFTIRLPYGFKYTTAIASKDYVPLNNELNLVGYTEYAAVEHNVFAERKDANMAVLSGHIVNIKTEKNLAPHVPVKLKVNGVESMGFRYDSSTAAYTLKLPVGVSYDILPAVKNFYNKYEQVDLTKVRKGTKIAKNFYVTPIEVGQTVNIDFIYFETGKSMLKPASFRSLDALVEFLNEYPNVKVEIGGHTDNTGSAAVNQRLSEQRAKAVADYVVSRGVARDRIASKGYSSTKPKASNATAKGRAENRRVEFTIIDI